MYYNNKKKCNNQTADKLPQNTNCQKRDKTKKNVPQDTYSEQRAKIIMQKQLCKM